MDKKKKEWIRKENRRMDREKKEWIGRRKNG